MDNKNGTAAATVVASNGNLISVIFLFLGMGKKFPKISIEISTQIDRIAYSLESVFYIFDTIFLRLCVAVVYR